VEATKYTEVGYYGRDVESMVRELVENAITLVTERERKKRGRRSPSPRQRHGCSICWLRLRQSTTPRPTVLIRLNAMSGHAKKMRAMLVAGELEQAQVEITIEQRAVGR